MASKVYNKLKANLLSGAVDLATDVIKVALMGSGHSASTADDNVWSDVSANELAAGGGYSTGGATLTGQTVTQGTVANGNISKWDATDVQWTSATFTAYYAVLYDSTVLTNLILSIDFGVPAGLQVVGGTFKIAWNIHGILTLA